MLASLLGADERTLTSELFDLLADRTPAPDDLLPSTGLALQRERDHSAAFIAAAEYGTRASTLVLVRSDGDVLFRERGFGPYGKRLGDITERFVLQNTAITPRRAAAAT